MNPLKDQAIRQLSKDGSETEIPAERQILTESWNRITVSPQLAYLPEKNQVMMVVSCDYDELMFQEGMIDKSLLHHSMVLFSDDEGTTWSEPEYVHTGADGKSDCGLGLALTYLGDGKVILYNHHPRMRWFSNDYGKTWDSRPIEPAPGGKKWTPWHPALVDKDPKTSKVTRIMECGYTGSSSETTFCQAYLRFSSDEGRTWSEAITVYRAGVA